jgi:hypothetical protein
MQMGALYDFLLKKNLAHFLCGVPDCFVCINILNFALKIKEKLQFFK